MRVHSASGSYPVVVSRGAFGVLADLVGERRAFVVTTQHAAEHAAVLSASLHNTAPIELVGDGEEAKGLTSVERLLVWFAQWRVTSGDVVIAVGGGALTDLVGFSAGVWRRGVPWIAVPTTVACAVDAGIGGKTAVNTLAGKNTAGRLWDPDGVICDPSCFDTLTGPVLADGLAEVIKVGCSHDPGLIDAIVAGPGAGSGRWLDPVVSGAAQVAVDVASGRYGPGDNPDVLSLGHEIAHALETLSEFGVGHGAAVSVGMRFSQSLLSPDAYRVAPKRLDQVIEYCGLPLTAREAGVEVGWASVREELSGDKRMGGRLRFLVALDTGTVWSADIDEDTAEHIWESTLRG